MKKYLDRSALTDGYPLAYLITFSCYGTHLPGDLRGSVDSRTNVYGTPSLTPNALRQKFARSKLKGKPYYLDQSRRRITLRAIKEICCEKGWDLIACHVRLEHLHSVVGAQVRPERIRGAFKYRSSQGIRKLLNEASGMKRWTVGGSDRYLWTPEHVAAAVDYVILDQGEPMEAYEKPCWQLQFS